MLNLKALSTLIPLITKLTPTLTITTTSSTFLLIKEISNSNNESQYDKTQRQEDGKKAQDFQVRFIVLHGELFKN